MDGIGPFFVPVCASEDDATLNWSKVPFERIEKDGRLPGSTRGVIVEHFRRFAERVALVGYDAVSLDDVAHLVCFDFYPEALKRKLADYDELYSRIFETCLDCGLKVFVSTDIMFFNDHIERCTRKRDSAVIELLCSALKGLFGRHPRIDGVIARFGESDGVDVENEFQSRLVIRTPRQARAYVQGLLPVFEEYDRTLVVRTWTLGAYKVGDLMWNRKTYNKVFGGVDSAHLVVSLKFGESDFYRHLQLNPLFFEGTQRKIIELQTRREYEGCGEFPSFVGYDYERYFDDLSHVRRLAGIHVWCQTGGWARFRRLTYLDNSSLWNEVNTFVTVKIFRDGMTTEEAVAAWCRANLPGCDAETMARLLRLSDRVVKELWYLPDFSQRRLYFRRVRVPPLLWVFWDTIVINHPLRRTIKRLVTDRRESIDEGYRSLHMIEEMKRLAGRLGLDQDDFEFQYDTFALVAVAREYFLGRWSNDLRLRIEQHAKQYRARYPKGFLVEVDFSPFHIRKRFLKLIFSWCLRTHRHYHISEMLFLIRFTGWFYPLIRVWECRRLPEFTRKQAMGLEVLFK